MKEIEHVEEIVRDAFGLWISALFSAIGSWNPGMSFDEQKNAFFQLVEDLLCEGKILFISPDADCYISPENPSPRLSIHDVEAHWNESAKVIVAELRSQWPVAALDANDSDVTTFFYTIPGVIWVRDDGTLVAS